MSTTFGKRCFSLSFIPSCMRGKRACPENAESTLPKAERATRLSVIQVWPVCVEIAVLPPAPGPPATATSIDSLMISPKMKIETKMPPADIIASGARSIIVVGRTRTLNATANGFTHVVAIELVVVVLQTWPSVAAIVGLGPTVAAITEAAT